MFTGLIEDLGTIREIGRKNGSFVIKVDTDLDLSDSKIGDSISISGICLTVVDLEKNSFSFDVSPETMSRTLLKNLGRGDKVNLERAMKLNDRFGGHIVSGHIDGTGTILNKTEEGNSIKIEIEVATGLSRYIVEKGSVAVDGVSMTVNGCREGSFTINVIPHTAEYTTLILKKMGDKINVETDLIGKYVEKILNQTGVVDNSQKKDIDYKFLEESGFI